ncbi:MAG: BNR repeat-containing protein [Lacunisphaera sp.]|nr:BNR repeat-containing protein [Lacunisphaera sp.]
MLRFRLLLLGACLLLLHPLPAAEPPAAVPTGELIDRVWAGHPVSFALLTERGHQFIAYYDAERRLTVAGRKLGETAWTRVQPPGVPSAHQRDSNRLGWDSHNYLRLALDRAGCLHVSGNMHVDPLVYYRTRAPFDLTTLERVDRMTGDRETHCTYPVFFNNAAGDLLFRYRDGSSGNGADLYNIYDEPARTWRRVLATPLLDGEGRRNAYALDPQLGPDGRFHLVWMWRDTPDCATNHTLSYARSRDFVQWENSRGEPLARPITLATGEVIDPARPGEGLINMTFNLGFDAAQLPVVVYHRYDEPGHSQAYAARPRAAGGWAITPLSTWDFTWAFSGNGSIAGEVTLGPPRLADDGMLLVDYSTQAAGSGRWRVNAATLATVAQLPAAPAVLPDALLRPADAASGLEVQTVVARHQGRRYVLRWETLPRNRDRPRDAAPPPAELRLYELPDTEAGTATRVGS